jgi:hypothetical protein
MNDRRIYGIRSRSPNGVDDAYHAALLDLVDRLDINPALRYLLKHELTRGWYPDEYREEERKTQAERDRHEIEVLAAALKAEGQLSPKTEAEKKVAERQGVTVHALRQRRYRKT